LSAVGEVFGEVYFGHDYADWPAGRDCGGCGIRFRMTQRSFFFAAIFAFAALTVFSADSARAQDLAPTPPMGWNSWDAYGFTIDENDFKANVTVLAGMKQYGWSYAVIDEGW